MIKGLRYEGQEYLWINDMKPVMVMHPFKPELDGKDLAGFKDPNGKALFVAFVDVVKAKGAGYVDYLWPKPGASAPVPKVSYVQGFAPWGWLIGSGIYVDDVEAQFWADVRNTAIGVGALLCIVLFAFGTLARMISRRLAHATVVARDIAKGDLTDVVEVGSQDEIGQLMAALQEMETNLRSMVGAIRGSAHAIGESSAQIAEDSTGLASRAASQTASLEETAASMEELTQGVKQNSDNAAQANELAREASAVAAKGGRRRRRGGRDDGHDQHVVEEDRRHHRRHRRHRLPDQHPGAQRRRRSGTRRRAGPRLRRGGHRGAQPGPAQRRGGEGDQDADRRASVDNVDSGASWSPRPAARWRRSWSSRCSA